MEFSASVGFIHKVQTPSLVKKGDGGSGGDWNKVSYVTTEINLITISFNSSLIGTFQNSVLERIIEQILNEMPVFRETCLSRRNYKLYSSVGQPCVI